MNLTMQFTNGLKIFLQKVMDYKKGQKLDDSKNILSVKKISRKINDY